MNLYKGFLKAIGCYEPSMDEFLRHFEPTNFDQVVMCWLWVCIVLGTVYILDNFKKRPKWIDDLVIIFVILVQVCFPFVVCKMPPESLLATTSWIHFFGGVSCMCNMYWLGKYANIKPKNALKVATELYSMAPTEQKLDAELGDRIKELAPLAVFEILVVCCYNFLFPFVEPFLPFVMITSILTFILKLARDVDLVVKKARKNEA